MTIGAWLVVGLVALVGLANFLVVRGPRPKKPRGLFLDAWFATEGTNEVTLSISAGGTRHEYRMPPVLAYELSNDLLRASARSAPKVIEHRPSGVDAL